MTNVIVPLSVLHSPRSTSTFALSSPYMSFTQYEPHTTIGYQMDNQEVGFGMREVRLMKENLISSFLFFYLWAYL